MIIVPIASKGYTLEFLEGKSTLFGGVLQTFPCTPSPLMKPSPALTVLVTETLLTGVIINVYLPAAVYG